MKNPSDNPGSAGAWSDEVKIVSGDPAPALEGELLCTCGELEGVHRVDGTCELSGCAAFAPADGIRVEYDAGAR